MSSAAPSIGAIRRVLLATDQSEFSAGAEEVALSLAKDHGVPLTAMTMVLSAPELDAIAPERIEQAEDQAVEYLDGLVERAGERGVAIEPLVRHGLDPALEITAAAGEIGANVIVMGRRGRRGLARVMLGDATARVVGSAGCCVLVVPKAARSWSKRILLATDGSKFAEAASEVAAAMARQRGLPVTVLSSIRPVFNAERGREAVEIAARTSARFKAAGLDADGVVENGDPEVKIIELAAARGADLIVMGTRGRNTFEKMLMGSVTERVLSASTCPVMTVRVKI